MRENGEKSGYNFKTAKHKAIFDYQIETKDIDAILEPSQMEKVNNAFALESALFVANQSEVQVDYITDTNEKEISDAEKMAVILFFTEQSKLTSSLAKLRLEKERVDFEHVISQSNSITAAKKKKIQEKIEATEKELAELIANKDKFIADEIERKIVARGETRSPLIAEQNVGLAQSFAKATEENLVVENVDGAEFEEQNWRSILDSHTRYDHAVADGQKKVNGYYVVGGHRCTRPYDPVLPIDQTAGCRCVEETKVVFAPN